MIVKKSMKRYATQSGVKNGKRTKNLKADIDLALHFVQDASLPGSIADPHLTM